MKQDIAIETNLYQADKSAPLLRKQRELLQRIGMIIKGNGAAGLLWVFISSFILPFISTLHLLIAPCYRPFIHNLRRLTLDREMAYWRSMRDFILLTGRKGYFSTLDDLGLPVAERNRLAWLAQQDAWIKVADIDQDGFFLSQFGLLAVGPCISWQEFKPRTKFRLSLVVSHNLLGVRKEFRGNRLKFLNELKSLHTLALAGCRVPALLDVDFENLDIVVSFIKGKVLRHELVNQGAAILDRQVQHDPQLQGLSAKTIWLERIKRGRDVLPRVIDAGFIETLFTELQKIHQNGIVISDFKYGNIIIEKTSGEPYLIDFENTFSYARTQGAFFRFLRDIDREQFNLHFGTEKVTYRRLRAMLNNRDLPAFEKWYAPLYIGWGLKIGRTWDIDVGSGRWRYILKNHLPECSGKRILDLGANNGFNGIHMLRHGAREVIGIELDGDHILQGHLVKQVYEWADNRTYNFRYIQADMADIPNLNLGDFDYVTAFCCIYYLDDKALYDLIRHISKFSETLVLQCNHYGNVGRKDPHTYEKATREYALQALKSNGFPRCDVIAPAAYKRPLVIGNRQ